jgi:hypothetical protein
LISIELINGARSALVYLRCCQAVLEEALTSLFRAGILTEVQNQRIFFLEEFDPLIYVLLHLSLDFFDLANAVGMVGRNILGTVADGYRRRDVPSKFDHCYISSYFLDLHLYFTYSFLNS